ncbi:hypothetical protein V3G39_12710 [Dermatophilaceae bacterium Sec6.4]
MAFEAVRSTLTIATMIGAAVKERAGELAEGLLEVPGVGPSAVKMLQLGGQIGEVTEELTALVATNRSAIADVLRAEIDLQLQRVGLSTPGIQESSRAEIDRLTAQIADLRKALEAASAVAASTPTDRPRQVRGTSRAPRKGVAKATAARKVAATTASTKKAATRKPSTSRASTTSADGASTPAKVQSRRGDPSYSDPSYSDLENDA